MCATDLPSHPHYSLPPPPPPPTDTIEYVQVYMKQTVRYKRTTTANVTILRVSNETYMGSLNLMVWFNGSTLPVEGTVNIDDSNKQLMLKLEISGELILTFVAANDLSSQFQDIQVNVASESPSMVSYPNDVKNSIPIDSAGIVSIFIIPPHV